MTISQNPIESLKEIGAVITGSSLGLFSGKNRLEQPLTIIFQVHSDPDPPGRRDCGAYQPDAGAEPVSHRDLHNSGLFVISVH